MAGEIIVDLLGNRKERIQIPENGVADFPVSGGSVAVWIPERMAQRIAEAASAL